MRTVEARVVSRVGRLKIGMLLLARERNTFVVVHPTDGVMFRTFSNVHEAERVAWKVDVKWRQRSAQRRARRATRLGQRR